MVRTHRFVTTSKDIGAVVWQSEGHWEQGNIWG